MNEYGTMVPNKLKRQCKPVNLTNKNHGIGYIHYFIVCASVPDPDP